MSEKKISIIGSGLGGLVAGNLLAQKGHRVTIFESHRSPGGYTAGFRRKGYYFESGTLSFESSASVFKAMKDLGIRDKIDFVRQKFRLLSEDFDSVVESYGGFKKMLYQAYPSDRERLDRYFLEVDRMHEAFANYDEPMPFLYDGPRYILAMIVFMAGGMKALQVMKKYENTTASEFTGRFFEKDSTLWRIMKNFAYPDMSAWLIGASYGFFLEDYWTVKSGMQSWADVLAENFKSLGGELKLGAPVDRIITKQGAAAGVSSGGTDYEADYVISACDYKKTFLQLIDDKSLIPDDLMKKIEGSAVSEGIFTVYAGLNKTAEELAKHMRVPHLSCCFEKPGCNIYDAHDAHYFEKTAFGLYSPSLLNPAHAPEGKSSLMIQAMAPGLWMDNWGGGDRDKYDKLKEKVLQTLLDRASTVIPDLKKALEFQEAATPLTYERYTNNTGGATSAWSWNPNKRFFDNTMSFQTETPVKNLFIGSCWASQMGGVPGAIGAAYLCAKKIR